MSKKTYAFLVSACIFLIALLTMFSLLPNSTQIVKSIIFSPQSLTREVVEITREENEEIDITYDILPIGVYMGNEGINIMETIPVCFEITGDNELKLIENTNSIDSTELIN
ncbi:MAG: hypothetical protein IJ809_05980 [Clostridia bacterium]|nr:hypothetical protein [Clostridia bacterium]